jgi:hypothetical protein
MVISVTHDTFLTYRPRLSEFQTSLSRLRTSIPSCECLVTRCSIIHSSAQPLRQPFVAALRLVQPLNLLLKHNENAAWRITGSNPVGKWVLEGILLRALLVRFQGIVEI